MYDTMSQGTAAVNNLPLVMERFNRGEFDVISVGRAMLDDPEWTRKVRAGLPFKGFEAESLEVLHLDFRERP